MPKGLVKSFLALALVAAALAAALASGVPAAGAATPVAGKSCPTSPGGWTADPSNPTIFGPAQQPGQHHTMLTCTYTQGKTNTVSVIAEYADPNDPNPNSDFYYGCKCEAAPGLGSHPPSVLHRESGNWSYVEFSDPGHQLPNGAVPAFEQVAKTLLANVAHLAHYCELDTATPTDDAAPVPLRLRVLRHDRRTSRHSVGSRPGRRTTS